jgi:hypothetical protein
VLYGGRAGFMTEWRLGFQAPCASVAYSSYTFETASALDPDILLTTSDPSGVYLIRLVPPAAVCPNP